MRAKIATTQTQSLFFKNMKTKQPQICFSILKSTDIEEAARCVTRTFVENNPVTLKMKTTHTEHDVYSYHICKIAADTGLSLVAREKGTNAFIGCMIVHPANIDDTTPPLSKKFEPIFAILEKTTKKLPLIKHADTLVHLLTLTVHKEYQGYGIAKKIVALQLESLSQTAYQDFCIEFTNVYSYKALLSVLKDKIHYSNTIKYQDFMFNGLKPFDGVEGEMISCLNPIRSLKPEIRQWAQDQWIEHSIGNKQFRSKL